MKYTNKLVMHAAVFIMAAGILIACNQTQIKKGKLTEPSTETDGHPEHEAHARINLNSGAIWKADSSTNKNVLDLYTLIADANPIMQEDYHKTGKVLQTNINKIISECRMKGPDHDALHQWLKPLMEMNKKIAGVASVNEGKELFGMITKHIEKYSDYFEY